MLYDAVERKSYFSKTYDIHIVDRVEGDDGFTAGLIYGLITGGSCQRVVEFVTAASCLKHTIEGDYNRTTVEDVENLIKSGGGRVQR